MPKEVLPAESDEPGIIARRLRIARASLGLSQAEVAERAGVPRNNLSRWEGGTMPEAGALAKVATALQVSLDYLCGLSPEPTGLQPGKYIVNQLEVDHILAAQTLEELEPFVIRDELFANLTKIPSHTRLVDERESAEIQREMTTHVMRIAPELTDEWILPVLVPEGFAFRDASKEGTWVVSSVDITRSLLINPEDAIPLQQGTHVEISGGRLVSIDSRLVDRTSVTLRVGLELSYYVNIFWRRISSFGWNYNTPESSFTLAMRGGLVEPGRIVIEVFQNLWSMDRDEDGFVSALVELRRRGIDGSVILKTEDEVEHKDLQPGVRLQVTPRGKEPYIGMIHAEADGPLRTTMRGSRILKLRIKDLETGKVSYEMWPGPTRIAILDEPHVQGDESSG